MRDFDGAVIMTPSSCRNGTERAAAALSGLPADTEIIVNFQGDGLLTPPDLVERLITHMRANPDCPVATVAVRCSPSAYRHLITDQAEGRVGGTTAVFGAQMQGLYFSKEVIPYAGRDFAPDEITPVFHHVGVYAYRPAPLAAYPTWPEGTLEKLEGLEQLRFLENGRRILCVEVEARGRQFWELNNPEDIPRIESMLAEMGLA